MIIAPHNISRSRLAAIEDRFSSLHPQRHSVYKHDPGCCLLIIDHIGMLSSLYHYGKYCYIGGGFGKGIHNILEAAVHGKPVLFGPNFNKFREAFELIKAGGAFCVFNATQMKERIDFLHKDPMLYQMAAMMSKEFILRRTGATSSIFTKIFRSGKLT